MTGVYLGLFVGLLTVKAGTAPNALTGSWELIPHCLDSLAQSIYKRLGLNTT